MSASPTANSHSSVEGASGSPASGSTAQHLEIRVLDYSDIPKATATLIDAFKNDSLAILLASDLDAPHQRHKFEEALYGAYLHQHISAGLCVGINEHEDSFETVAIWLTPESMEKGLESFPTLMSAGYGDLWNMCNDATRQKVFYGMLPLLHDSCERILTNDSRFKGKGVYTLVYVGSTAMARGKGNARKMFDYMFQNHIDVPGSNNIAYLESSAASNIPIYERFGFHFIEDITLGNKTNVSVEGQDYATMNVMIRGSFGHDWTQDENVLSSKL